MKCTNIKLRVKHVWKSVLLMNSTTQEYRHSWSFVLPHVRVCTDSRKIELIRVVEQPGGLGLACSIDALQTNSSYKQPAGEITMFFETYNKNVTVPWNASKPEWTSAADLSLGTNQVEVSMNKWESLDFCGHSWEINFINAGNYPLLTIFSDASNYKLNMNGSEITNGSVISGNFQIAFGRSNASNLTWTQFLPYNVSAERLKNIFENSYEAFQTVDVQEAAYR